MSEEDGSGEAAQTGSLVHAAAEGFHKNGGDQQAGLNALSDAVSNFPRADPKRAEKIFLRYASDPENQNADIVLLEQKIQYKIPPASFDPTGEPIVINGTLDQVRRDKDGVLRCWDIKTGKTYYGTKAKSHYQAQQAVYTIAAGVQPGGLICTDGYFRSGGKVHFRYECSLEDFHETLHQVAVVIAYARMKKPFRIPGSACEYCVHRDYDTCSEFMRSHVR